MCRRTKFKLTVSLLVMWAVLFLYLSPTGVAKTNDTFVFAPFANGDGVNISEIEAINFKPLALTEEEGFGRIFIYHTHTNEAYEKTDENRYTELASRSSDYSLTVKTVGDTMQTVLATFGIDSDHDTSNNEAQGYNKAYILSLASMNEHTEENGEYGMYIDVHRDAYAKNTVPTVEIDGKNVAKVMLVVGGRTEHYEKNYKLALAVKEALNEFHPKLCKKVLVVQSSNYNQISDSCLLIEVGDNANTVEEANLAGEYVAKALAKVINSYGEIN